MKKTIKVMRKPLMEMTNFDKFNTETWGLEFFERNQIVENKWQQSIRIQSISQ